MRHEHSESDTRRLLGIGTVWPKDTDIPFLEIAVLAIHTAKHRYPDDCLVLGSLCKVEDWLAAHSVKRTETEA